VPLYAQVKVNKGLSSSVCAVVRGHSPPYIGQSWTTFSIRVTTPFVELDILDKLDTLDG